MSRAAAIYACGRTSRSPGHLPLLANNPPLAWNRAGLARPGQQYAGAAQPEQGTAAARRCRDMPLELTRRVHVAALNQHWHSAAVNLLHTVCGCLTGIVQDAPRVEGQCRWRHRRQGWGSSSSAWWDGMYKPGVLHCSQGGRCRQAGRRPCVRGLAPRTYHIARPNMDRRQ